MTPLSHLYVHVPFCHRICPYCSFYKHQPGATDIPAFLEALIREAEMAKSHWGDRLDAKTIYWGGGTPSMLSVRHLENFLPRFLTALGDPRLEEWTVEMNPRSLTEEKLSLLRTHGVTRASLGVQAWDEAALRILGRDHTPQDAEDSYAALRDAGFSVISLDLMFSVPGQSLTDWLSGLRRTISLRPDHISCYNLTYEEDTAFFERFSRGEYRRDDALDESFFTATESALESAGFVHYETSNYARPGCESRHNSAYWKGADYLGLGPSAVSTVDRRRSKNVADTARYVALIEKGWSAATEIEDLTLEQWRCERLALELRTIHGIALEMLGLESRRQVPNLIANGLAMENANRLVLTRRGRLVVDSIVEHLWV